MFGREIGSDPLVLGERARPLLPGRQSESQLASSEREPEGVDARARSLGDVDDFASKRFRL
jgi:hypothetical protein